MKSLRLPLPRNFALFGFALLLGACSGDSGTTRNNPTTVRPSTTTQTLSGFVGSPSLTGATITLLADDGSSTVSTRSGSEGGYTLTVNKALTLPITLQVEGGTDLFSGQANSQVLTALSFDPTLTSLSVSHLSTLAARMAACEGTPTESGLARSWSSVSDFSGLPAVLDPNDPDLDTLETAAVMQADIILAESMVRAMNALSSAGAATTSTQMFDAIACDLNDDGALNLSRASTPARLVAVFRASRAALLAEFGARMPHVGGQEATALINEALRQVSGDPDAAIEQLPVSAPLLDAASDELSLLLDDFGDSALLELLIAAAAPPVQAADALQSALTSARLTTLWSLPERLALADTSLLQRLADRMFRQTTATPPIVSFSASEESVAVNDSVTLNWAATNADVCRSAGAWSGNRALDGVLTIAALSRTVGFELHCAGLKGVTSEVVEVSVIDATQPATVTLTVDDATLPYGGQSRLRWSSSNADRCRASGDWSGQLPVLGSRSTGTLQADARYTMNCSGPGGSDSATVRVTVSAAPPPAPTMSFSATPRTINSGQSVNLAWNSSNASSCQAANGWSGTRASSGTESVGPLTANTSFRLTCSGSGGSVTRTRSVTVIAAPVPAPTLTLSAARSTVDPGTGTRLSWSSSNATSCSASGGWSGGRATSGTAYTGALNAATTYTLACSGSGGTIRRSTTVSVNSAAPTPAPSPAPAPTVSLSAQNRTVNAGSSTTLNWSSSNATSCTASGGWSGNRATSGSASTGPLNVRTTFSLNCSGSGGNALGMVSVSVNGTMTLTWMAPTENVDGTRLTDLAGYRVYFGNRSRNYTGMRDISNPNTTSRRITLPSGDYYVAMTALDQEGNESAYSNEVLKTVQ